MKRALDKTSKIKHKGYRTFFIFLDGEEGLDVLLDEWTDTYQIRSPGTVFPTECVEMGVINIELMSAVKSFHFLKKHYIGIQIF
jgi:hypothetical protein